MHPRGKMVGSDLLWLTLASCTLTLACALQQGNRSPRDVHSQVQYLSCGDPGTTETDACFDPCENYQEINDTTRSTEFKEGTKKNAACDIDLSGWYRFVGGGGVQMPNTCVPVYRCQADAPVWMSGEHPSVEDGIVNRTACANWAENCCFWELVMQVKACPGGYYVYQLEGTPTCSLRYCSEHCEKTCLPGEECQYRNGAWGCFCTREPDIENLKPKLECGASEITLRIDKSLLEGLCLGEDVTGHLLDQDCSSIQQEKDDTGITVTVALQDCDYRFILEGNETHPIYKNTLSFVNDLVNSDTTLNINFQCTYSIHIDVSLPNALKPIDSSTTIYVEGEGETGKEEFNVVMTLFKNEDFTDPYEEDVIELPVNTMLYVSVKLVERAAPYLLLWNCYATTTPDRDDPLKYFFIEKGCVSPHEEHTEILKNGVCSEARFLLQLFTLRKPLVYLHCETHFCDEPCEPTCPPRSEKPDIGSTQVEHLGPSTLRGAQALPVVSGTPRTAGFLVAWPVVLLPVLLAWLF